MNDRQCFLLLGMAMFLLLCSCASPADLTEEEQIAAQRVEEVSKVLADSIWQDDTTGAIYSFVTDGALGVFLADGTQFEGSYSITTADSTSPPIIDMNVPELMTKSIQRVVSDVEDDSVIYSDGGSTLSRVSD